MCYNAQSALYYFLYEDECTARFSHLHECTFKSFSGDASTYSFRASFLGNSKGISDKVFSQINFEHKPETLMKQ